jgi:metallo-beta-lactamase family protein
LFFTGDMGRKHMPILKDPVVLSDVDILITESTYGNRDHPAHEDVKNELAELCAHVVDNEARLLIPAFSVGRTQQIVYFLHELSREGRIAEIPVYVDSPLSTKATTVYEEHTECYDAETIALLRKGDQPFSFPRLRYVTDTRESKRLNDMRGPAIIISASGMCEGGRILHHLKHTVGDERNIILIVGYQAEHTLGRRLVEKEKRVRIFGDEFDVRARVKTINALSAHADRNEMRAYYEEMNAAVDEAFVVHGEAEACTGVARALDELGARHVHIPEPGDEYDL